MNRKTTTEKKIVLTGDRPTGKLHLGHYIGSLQNRVAFQDQYTQYVMIADMQALTDNAENPEKVRNNILEVALDYLSVGIDPSKSTIFIQSMVPQLSELTMYFLNLVTLGRAQQNPTVKEEMKQKGYRSNVPLGFLSYPVSQAADILAFKTDLVPVGQDQLPVIEQTNEIADKFNRIYAPVLKRVEAVVPKVGFRLPGIEGKAKMSKSLGNAIYLSDSAEELSKKVMQMYTDPSHIHAGDPGKVEGNVVFTYLDVFDSDKEGVAELKKQYKKGGLGDVVLKKRLIGILENLLAPKRAKRMEWAGRSGEILEMLYAGTAAASLVAARTLGEAREAMHIDYRSMAK
jgi:tryptophanyl-tRNA synthetase